ncbi:hypothetical protein SCHPADRAFT_839679, partial [Schizopora paradoxa]
PPRGAFKCATFGEVSPKLPCGTTSIVAKQTMESARGTSKHSSSTNGDIPMVGKDQLAHLGDEITCLMWASAFTIAVGQYVTQVITVKGDPPFDVPHFEYVTGALAMEVTFNHAQEKRVNAWLLERCLTEDEQGPWRKYINNDSPVPLKTKNEDDLNRANFLAFSQHLQYKITGKLAFVSDYQGKLYSVSTIVRSTDDGF